MGTKFLEEYIQIVFTDIKNSFIRIIALETAKLLWSI
jgi:hypothetical protein